MARRVLARIGPGIAWVLGLAALVFLWEQAVRGGLLRPSIFPSPSTILEAGAQALMTGRFWSDVTTTGSALALGVVTGLVAGELLGLLLGLNRWFSAMFEWPLSILNAVPRFALAPLVIIALGLGIASRAMLAFLGVVIPIGLLVAVALRTAPRQYANVSAVYGITGWRKLVKVHVPMSLPNMFAGLQLGFTQALIAVIVAEMYNPRAGLGRWIVLGQTGMNPGQIWFASLLVGAVGAALLALLRLLGRRVAPWPA